MTANRGRNMDKVYVVRGSCGSYEDHYEWLVFVYPTKREAEKHRIAAQSSATEIYEASDQLRKEPGINEWDAHMCLDFGGAYYRVEEVSYRETMKEIMG
jgi:hypothetical protein